MTAVVGSMICHQIDEKKVDFLLIGRRGMSKIKRFFVGSNSRYLTEHANCNVIVIKGEWGPPEEHSDKKDIVKLEEEERKRRIEEDKKLEQQNLQQQKVQ